MSFLEVLSTLFFETVSHSPKAHQVGKVGWPASMQRASCLYHSPVPGLQVHAATMPGSPTPTPPPLMKVLGIELRASHSQGKQFTD